MNRTKKQRYLIFFLISLISIYANAQIQSNPPEPDNTPEHIPGQGFRVLTKPEGTLSISTYATIRYLNQVTIDDSYTDAFGRTRTLKKRNDIQFQKAVLYFKGWLMDPNFRYLMYVWTSNANMGQGAQVVVGGNLQYRINKHFDVGAGIGALPTSRCLLGQWPTWLRQDARPMAEEFFRGSFTTGIWLQGDIVAGLHYKTMLGNNLSQLGIDAGQLDNGFDSWSTALWWTSKDYGDLAPLGDFNKHKKPSGLIGGSFTRSNETRQSQPGTEDPENTQIRVSDGTGVFTINAFDDSSQVTAAKYQMMALYGGIKYKGLSLDAEYYMRWVSDFEYSGRLPISSLFDNGFSLQASGMIIDKTLQLYGVYSYINGEYGKPSELNLGLNWYPFRNRILRINPEVIFADHSPVGYLSYPTVVGANGTIYMVNLELFY